MRQWPAADGRASAGKVYRRPIGDRGATLRAVAGFDGQFIQRCGIERLGRT